MRAFAVAILVGLLVSAVALPLGGRPAAACSCAPLPSDIATLDMYLDRLDGAFLTGTVVQRVDKQPYSPLAIIRTEHVYAGRAPGQFELDMFICNGFNGQFEAGERWILHVSQHEGTWRTSDCTSISLAKADARPFEAALNAYAGGTPLGRAYGGSGNDWLTPPVVALILVSVATATLAAVYVAQRRKSSIDR
jgi:hypothetical protein